MECDVMSFPYPDAIGRKSSPGLPDQQQWLGTLSGAHPEGPGGWGRGPVNRSPNLKFGRGMAS
eukprot:1156832-Pelagomonas_calceolata.AAC.3